MKHDRIINRKQRLAMGLLLCLALLCIGYFWGTGPQGDSETAGTEAGASENQSEAFGEPSEAGTAGDTDTSEGSQPPDDTEASVDASGSTQVPDDTEASGDASGGTQPPDDTKASVDASGTADFEEPPDAGEKESLPEAAVEYGGSYTSREDVALYLELFGELPCNFITKKEARELGWEGGSLEPYAPGMCIGGDRFGNYEGLLPEKDGRTYRECDIDTLGADSRGSKRLVFSNDGLIYYTEDHYESFELLYDAGE